MDDDRARRAEERRRSWRGGVASPAEAERADLEFWRDATPLERLAAVTALGEEWYRLTHPDGAAPRLDRSAFGVRRRRG